MSDGNDDNITKIKGGKEPSAFEKAVNAVEKVRKEGFENKMKEKVKLLIEARRAVKLVEKEIDQMQKEYDEGM